MSDLTLAELQQLVADYDKENWQHKSPELDNIRHNLHHLVKAAGKMATYVEACEHGGNPSAKIIIKQVIPDLLMYFGQAGQSLRPRFGEVVPTAPLGIEASVQPTLRSLTLTRLLLATRPAGGRPRVYGFVASGSVLQSEYETRLCIVSGAAD